MKSRLTLSILALSLSCASYGLFDIGAAHAQQAAPTTPAAKDSKPKEAAKDAKKEDKKDAKKDAKKDGAKQDGAKEGEPAQADPTAPVAPQTGPDGQQQPQAPVEATEPSAPDEEPGEEPIEEPVEAPVEEPDFEPVPEPEPDPEPTKKSPIADLAQGQDFVPLQDIEEETLDPIFPAKVYPHLEWDGYFRLRTQAFVGLDLDTNGTSAVLPPAERYTPVGNPADPAADTLWSTNMRLKLEPTFHIAEGVSVHIEADLLNNMVLGASPITSLPSNPLTPDPSRNAFVSTQYSPREREWFSDALQIQEAYGELNGFFGTIRAGRMDNHWGMGAFFNNGDCLDCDFGDHIDRVMLQSQFRGFYGNFSIDFPNDGETSTNAGMPYGQPYDLTQKDDIDQFTISLFHQPQTRIERELERKRLIEDRKPVFNGGLLFSWRDQEGTYVRSLANEQGFDPTAPPELIWKGMSSYLLDGWVQFLYQPNAKTSMRLELEAIGILGSYDNATNNAVGQRDPNDENSVDINCFSEDERNANETICKAQSRDFRQFALALQSEFSVGAPVNFGFNGGFASGGSASNWGYKAQNGQDLDFFRFDPDYHVDLILFRRVIGTVTNAFYFNPYVTANLLERGDRKLALDVDAILSRAANTEGTPAGDDAWLGFELDAALRFIQKGTFEAALQGGLLFPLGGLNAVTNRESLTTFGTNTGTFAQDREARTAWTVQLHLDWQF